MKEHSADKGPPGTLALVFSVITHLLLLWPVVYIVEVALEDLNNNSLFVWHPICMSLGAGLVLMEGVFAISGEAYVSKKLSRGNRIRLHWICNATGLALLAVGLIIIIINKNVHDKPHFATTHGVLGLVTFVLTCCIASFGILANNAQWFYPRVRPVLLKVVHAFAGIALTVLLLVTLVNGTYNNWWSHIGASSTWRALILASFAVAAVLILVKPIIGAFARSRVLMRPRPQAQQPVVNST